MFLIVFVTLIVSIIGLYAQVVSLQTAKINAAQSALTQTMITWHGAAASYVQSLYSTTNVPSTYDPPLPLLVATGCLVSPIAATTVPLPTGMTYCLDGSGNQLIVPAPGGAMGLPIGYNASNFAFFTFVYQAPGSSTPYVVTYVDPTSVDGSGHLILPTAPTATTVGYTIYDVMRQFSNITTNYLAYGTVLSSGVLTLMGASNGTASAGITFQVPPAPTIPVGSVAIISAAN